MMNGLKILEWNEIRMEETSKEKEKTEEEDLIQDKSAEDLENELKNLQRKIEASSGVIKHKLKNQIEKNIIKEKPKTTQIVQISPQVLDEETEVKSIQNEEIKKIWELYNWANDPKKFGWMYWVPDKKSGVKNWKENLESWINDWSKFTIDWARVFILHIIDMYEITKEKPFVNLNDREKALTIIFNNLVEMKRGKNQVAQWTGKEKNKIRIYWRSLEEWANLFYDWAFNGGGDIFTQIGIRKASEEILGFDTLPEEDLREIINILVKQKKARWIDKKLIRVKVIFKGL